MQPLRLQNINFDKYKLNFQIALEAVMGNRVRAILTALGIIFGVAAVIAMLAIGNGAKKELLEQMKLVGVNNIIITPKIETPNSIQNETTKSEGEDKEQNENNLSLGLNLQDAYAIQRIVSAVKSVSPETHSSEMVIYKRNSLSCQFAGIHQNFFEIYNLELQEGSLFNIKHHQQGDKVCVIGHNVAVRLFPTENPIGKYIKCGGLWLRVIGVLKSRLIEEAQQSSLQLDDFNYNVYAPLQTVLLRYNDRSIVTNSRLQRGEKDEENTSYSNYNQLDKLIVQIDNSEHLSSSLEIIRRLLKRRHAGVQDYTITVPELLLKQEQKTRNIFNIVLAAIASISLIVGGIGIMNIMLASVLERVREIGLRRAIGARKEDVILQFIAEAMLISFTGGLLGIILGVVIAKLISHFTDIDTVISVASILISFVVSVSVGLIFGYMPARKAALQDPVTSLRHE